MLTFKTQVVGNYERLAGFEAEAKALGVDGLCRAFEVGDEASENIREAFLPFAGSFDAVLCSDDMLVLPLLKGLRERGLKCPDDLAVLSWNDSPFLSFLEPSVSSFAIPVNGMGEKAADAILSYQAGERKLMRELLPEAISYRASFPKEGQQG